MAVKLEFTGGREMERALADLKRSTARGVGRRALTKAAEPIKSDAQARTQDYRIVVGGKLDPGLPSSRAARSENQGTAVTVYLGPVGLDGDTAPESVWTEFGTDERFHDSGKYTGRIVPEPFLRPAWDAKAGAALEMLGQILWAEIQKTVARIAAKGAK